MSPASRGSVVTAPNSSIAPSSATFSAQPARTVSADTTAASGGANSASSSPNRSARSNSTTVAATASGPIGAIVANAADAATATVEDHRRVFVTAMAVLLAEFDAYLDRETADPATDLVGYRQHAL